MTMTSMERVLKTLGHEEPDRVPLFILISFYGAKLLNMPIETYFSEPQNILKAQKLARERFHTDCYYSFHYASLEFEAFGGRTIFQEMGPPIAGDPVIKLEDIDGLMVPDIKAYPKMVQVLEAISLLKEDAGMEHPVAGVVMSPFSLPIMQMGFEAYLDLLINDPVAFEKLMKVNEKFCLDWANAQFEAGATFLAYFDPMLSTRMMPKTFTKDTGFKIANRMLSQFKGPAVIHFASGESLDLSDLVLESPAVGAAVSCNEALGDIKASYQGQKTVIGNLNALELVHWNQEELESHVTNLMEAAGPGGGFILSDTHGEIPWQVPEQQLEKLSMIVRQWGTYPIKRFL